MPKPQRPSPTKRDTYGGLGLRILRHPRRITEREQTLMALYIYWQFEMTPQQFYAKWEVTYEEMALICNRSSSTVQHWFSRHHYRRPTPTDLRHLALMDFLWEHFEEIPRALFDLLCYQR